MDANLFKKYKPKSSGRATERGELMKYFVDELNVSRRGKLRPLTIGRMGKVLQGLSVQDLYYMKSQFEDRLRRNGRDAASKHFWWSLREEKK